MMTLTPVIVPVPQINPPRCPADVNEQRNQARAALEHCAKLCGAPSVGWRKDADEAPLPNAGFHWSVSHKRQFAVAVIADQPVGIDIELVCPRDRLLHDGLAKDAEWAILGDRSWDAFFRLWTAKEATLKANGVGIGELLQCQLRVMEEEGRWTLEYRDRQWSVEHFRHAEHVVAVTCGAAKIEWCVLA